MDGSTPPIADYEGLPIAALQHRVRSLDEEQMRDLIAYEEHHAGRVGVLEILKHRLWRLEEGAEPSEGTQASPEPPADKHGEGLRAETGHAPRPMTSALGVHHGAYRTGHR